MGAGVDVPGGVLVGGTGCVDSVCVDSSVLVDGIACDISVCVDSGVLVSVPEGAQDVNMKASTKPIFAVDFRLILRELQAGYRFICRCHIGG